MKVKIYIQNMQNVCETELCSSQNGLTQWIHRVNFPKSIEAINSI